MMVTFHPDSYPLHWESCGQLAEFISHYTGLFFDGQTRPANEAETLHRSEVEDAINYILLELMQNALKFNTAGDIEAKIEIHEGELRFHVGNQIRPEDVPDVEAVFQELLTEDPGELLIRRIEENAADPDSYRSGLGFLTIMNDYGASLAWSFDEDAHPDHVRLTIITCFPVLRSGT
ncbi:MAG: hypothetical protein MJE77_29210 [Proteobacteria bacterium]|nr:hypothetical protein [Pseudomonadota bacterium]